MIRRFKHLLVGLLLGSYIAVGAVGHWDVIGRLWAFPDPPPTIKTTKPNPANTGRVYWTQQRHIPTVILISLAPHAAFDIAPEHPLRCTVLGVPENDQAFHQIVAIPSLAPRAPPIT